MNDYTALTEVARARYKLACDEMDRLTAGSPGTNWRWSIPANPDRDSDLILSASAEDVPRLADAVEALVAENTRLESELADADAHAQVNAMDYAYYVQMRAERDALQAQLDSILNAWVEYDDWRKEPYLYPDGTQRSRADDLYTACRDALGYGPKSIG